MRLQITCIVLVLSVAAAAIDNDQVRYVGGTIPAITAGSIGKLDTTPESALIFDSNGNKLVIPYTAIKSSIFSTEVAHHLGVLPGIAVGLLKKRERKHFLSIVYSGTDRVDQAVVFEVPKHLPRTLQAVLEARAPQTKLHCSICDTP